VRRQRIFDDDDDFDDVDCDVDDDACRNHDPVHRPGQVQEPACRYDPATGGHAFDTIATTTVAVQADRESRSSLRHLE
jgi:hypothetical protein